MGARATRPLHRLDPHPAQEEPAAGRRQPPVPHPALDPHPQPRIPHPRARPPPPAPCDWTRRYNTTPVLVETFVEVPRFTGGLYRASGWIRVGTTKGRGRYDAAKQYGKPIKDVWLCPLAKHWRRTLNR